MIWPILGLALLVRVWGIGFGLPHTWARPDESRLIGLAMRLGTGDLNPHIFNYPSLLVYVLFGLYALYYASGRLSGRFNGIGDFVRAYGADPAAVYLIDRGLSVRRRPIAGLVPVGVESQIHRLRLGGLAEAWRQIHDGSAERLEQG